MLRALGIEPPTTRECKKKPAACVQGDPPEIKKKPAAVLKKPASVEDANVGEIIEVQDEALEEPSPKKPKVANLTRQPSSLSLGMPSSSSSSIPTV
eukprot:6327812-Karenia_brevis.AAC.1